jgi:GT2 family glycosyltransferase
MNSDPRISVVIATRDRAHSLDRTLGRLELLPERPHVIVVDNRSLGYGTRAVVEKHPGVALIELDQNLGAAARNVGVRRANTPYVALADDDSWWASGALRVASDLMDAFPHLGLLAARILVGEDEHLDPVCVEMGDSPLGTPVGAPGPSVLGFVACGAVVRRAAFLGCGGFDDRLGLGGEERLLAVDLAAAGWERCYVHEIVAHHYPAERRDRNLRARLVARNRLWSVWLRQPMNSAVQATLRELMRGMRDRSTRTGMLSAVVGIPWVLTGRSVVSDELDAAINIIYN